MEQGITKKFIFLNRAEELYPCQQEILSHIISFADVNEELTLKVKLVLTELLTNAVKHAGCNESIITVSVQNNTLVIEKSDEGRTFSVCKDGAWYEWPLPGRHYAGKVFSLYSDDSYTVVAQADSNIKLKFVIWEHLTGADHDQIANLPEHFGLIIITRACYSFEYNFDIGLCRNYFTATFKLSD